MNVWVAIASKLGSTATATASLKLLSEGGGKSHRNGASLLEDMLQEELNWKQVYFLGNKTRFLFSFLCSHLV